jgi:hypothetical protein
MNRARQERTLALRQNLKTGNPVRDVNVGRLRANMVVSDTGCIQHLSLLLAQV